MENADFDRVLGLGGQRRQETKGKTRRGGKPAARRSPGDAPMGLSIAMSSCLTRATGPAPSRSSLNRKERAKQRRALRDLLGLSESADRRTAAASALI